MLSVLWKIREGISACRLGYNSPWLWKLSHGGSCREQGERCFGASDWQVWFACSFHLASGIESSTWGRRWRQDHPGWVRLLFPLALDRPRSSEAWALALAKGRSFEAKTEILQLLSPKAFCLILTGAELKLQGRTQPAVFRPCRSGDTSC